MSDPLADFRQATRDLRAMPTEIRREIRPGIRKAVQPIVSDARGRASWSSRIPGAIRVALLKRGVEIKVSRKRAPHARPYENRGRPGIFRHPMFGDRDWWVAQRARPFLWPAVRAHIDEVQKAITDVVERVARKHGFH